MFSVVFYVVKVFCGGNDVVGIIFVIYGKVVVVVIYVDYFVGMVVGVDCFDGYGDVMGLCVFDCVGYGFVEDVYDLDDVLWFELWM